MTVKQEKPQILEPLQDITVCDGESAVLSVQVSGNPPPEITWYKNDKPITDIPTKQEDTVYKCTLKKTTLSDTAKYSVTATNSMGTAKSSCNLVVERK